MVKTARIAVVGALMALGSARGGLSRAAFRAVRNSPAFLVGGARISHQCVIGRQLRCLNAGRNAPAGHVAAYFRRGTPRAAATLPELGSVDEPPDGGQADEQDGAPDKKPRRRGKERKWEGPLAYHQELTLRVDSLTNLGQGVCRMEDGWVIFVPFVIPGELVRLRVWRNHKNYSEADLLEVLEPSESRVTPHCQLFGTCGGCQYQHMQLTAQREWKQRHVRDVLERTGTLSGISVKPVMGTEHAFGYRTKITPHHEKPRKGEIMAIGFQRVGSRMLVDVEQCPIATPALNQRLATLRQEVREAARRDCEEGKGKKKGATLLLRDTEAGVATHPKDQVSDTVRGFTFRYQAGDFFQNNPFVLPLMVEHVVSRAQGPGLRFLVDAYCGGGLFAITASKAFEACYGIEISETNVLSARRNAEHNGVENCHFRVGTASDIFSSISHFPAEQTVVVVDPPRKGCDSEFLGQLFSFRPAKVVYVSCDPSTQARDAAEFVTHGYEVEDVQPFDLFPQTRHIENVITFRDNRQRAAE